MKVELRRFKSYPRLSQETIAFNADLWIDGVKVGEASNDGQGGPNRLHFTSHKIEKAFEAFCKAQPPHVTNFGKEDVSLDIDADFFVSLLVEAEERKTFIAKQKKGKVLFTLPGDAKGAYRTIKILARQTREAVEQYVKARYPAATII